MFPRIAIPARRPLPDVHRPAVVAIAAIALAVLTFIALPAQADCPASAIVCLHGNPQGGGSVVTTTSPTYDNTCEGVVMNLAGARFNVPGGTFGITVSEGGDIDLALCDAFTVTGPAAGSPIALHLRAHMHGVLSWDGACCPDSQAHVDLVPLAPQAGDPAAHWSFGKSSGPFQVYTFSDSLDLTLQRTAGAPIGIEIRAHSQLNASDSMNLDGDITFPDLPQGWTVTSCKGYRKEQPVPATPVSWGHVKAAYR